MSPGVQVQVRTYVMSIIGKRTVFSVVVKEVYRPIMLIT